MKKIYIFFIISFFFGLNVSKASYDDFLYNQNLQYENIGGSELCYSNYYYNYRFYKLYMPCSRQLFIELEFDVRNGDVPRYNYFYKLVFLNQLLIKKGMEPLYY